MHRAIPSVAIAAKANQTSPLGLIDEIIAQRPLKYARSTLLPLVQAWGSLFLDRAFGAITGQALTIGTRPDNKALKTDVAGPWDLMTFMGESWCLEWADALEMLAEECRIAGGSLLVFSGAPAQDNRDWLKAWTVLMPPTRSQALIAVFDSVAHLVRRGGVLTEADRLMATERACRHAYGIEPATERASVLDWQFAKADPPVVCMTYQRYLTAVAAPGSWWAPSALTHKKRTLVMVDGAVSTGGATRADVAVRILEERAHDAPNLSVLFAVRAVSTADLSRVRAFNRPG